MAYVQHVAERSAAGENHDDGRGDKGALHGNPSA
jgi:hypothetical protein